MADHSLMLMRVSLGFVFLLFGVLTFIPDASPAEGLSVHMMEKLSVGSGLTPTLEAQDVIKVIVLVTAGITIALRAARAKEDGCGRGSGRGYEGVAGDATPRVFR